MENITQAYCAREQKITDHTAKVDANGEYVFTCTSEIPTGELNKDDEEITEVCGRFIKLPADTEDFTEALSKHEEVNTGQVSIEKSEKKLDDFLKSQETSEEE